LREQSSKPCVYQFHQENDLCVLPDLVALVFVPYFLDKEGGEDFNQEIDANDNRNDDLLDEIENELVSTVFIANIFNEGIIFFRERYLAIIKWCWVTLAVALVLSLSISI
jgi:hypothetical protein